MMYSLYLPPVRDAFMGKYLIAWILGVPAIVLVVIYLLFHLF
jgi:hypothetical protein